MTEMQKTPQAVKDYLRSKTDVENGLLLLRADMGRDLFPKDVYVLVTRDKLYIAEGVVTVGRAGGFRKKSASCFKESYFKEYDIKSLRDFRMEEQVSGGMFTCRCGGKPALLFNYTGGCKHDVRILRDVLRELCENGRFDEAKLKADIGELPYCPRCGRRYPDPENRVCRYCVDKKKLTKKLAMFFVRYKGYMAMIVLTIAMVTGIGLLVPQISAKMFYNDVLTEGGRHYGRIWYVVGLIVGVRFVSLLVSLANSVISARISTRVIYDLKNTIYRAISRLSLGFFSSRQTGGLMTQINNDANTIYWFFCDGFPYLVTNLVQLVGVMVIMLLGKGSIP